MTETTPTQTAARLSDKEVSSLKVGEFIRVVDEAGRVAQGPVTKVYGYRNDSAEQLVIGGISWTASGVEFFRADPDCELLSPAPLALGVEDVLLLMAKLSHRRPGGAIYAISLDDLARAALGYSPSARRRDSRNGGRSKDAYTNEHFSLSAARKALGQLVDDGVLMAVSHGPRYGGNEHSRYISFLNTRSGWVFTADYEEVQSAAQNKANDATRAALRVEARNAVADRHTDEVEVEFERLLAAAEG